uniref:Uncharacterized protein n=1 Tax=Anguilla anguilla TaxID=7936 RepID=A0A0E9QE05_ANGAN
MNAWMSFLASAVVRAGQSLTMLQRWWKAGLQMIHKL